MRSYHLRITGKVQGVFYRQSARDKAIELDIKGWIRNNPDGFVEAHIWGEEQPLQAFLDWCGRGPEHAHVTDIIIESSEAGAEDNFVILRP